MTHVDTNYVLRFLVGDNKQQAKEALRFFTSSDAEIRVPTLVLAEVVYFLQSKKHYGQDKKSTVSAIKNIISKPNVYTEAYINLALNVYLSRNDVSFYDCLILAETLESKGKLMTFDKSLKKVFEKLNS